MHPTRRAGAITACLLLVLTACSGSSTPLSEEAADPCRGVTVTPGAGPIAWTVSTATDLEHMDDDPVGVGDGFLVGVSGCIGFVETAGLLRWTIPGLLDDVVRVDEILVIAMSGRPSSVGVDATTGAIEWSREDRGHWDDVAVQGRTVMLAGGTFDGSVKTVDASTGREIATRYPLIPDDGRFRDAVSDEGLLVTAGHANQKGVIVAADASGRVVLDAGAGVFFPDPVAVVGEIVVVQASGITGGGVGGEPRTHLVGIDRTTRTERWRRVLPGLQAGHAVEVGGVVVVRLKGGLSGVDARSGAVRWSVPLGEDYESPMVAVRPDAVALGESDGTVVLIEVADGRRRWSARTEGAVAVLGAPDADVLLAANDADFYGRSAPATALHCGQPVALRLGRAPAGAASAPA